MKKHNKILSTVVIALMIGFVIGYLFVFVKPFMVISINKIEWIKKPTLDVNNEYIGGTWRVTGTSDDFVVQLESKDMEVNSSEIIKYDAIETGMVIKSSIVVKIWQSINPYWKVQFKKIGTYVVTPSTYGTHYGAISPEKDQRVEATISELTVDVYQIDISSLKLVIPFNVKAYKQSVSGIILLDTDSPCLVKYPDGSYAFEFSEEELSTYTGNSYFQSRYIEFYNSNDRKENLTIALQYAVGSSHLYANSGLGQFYVIEDSGGDIVTTTNAFKDINKLSDIEKLLRYDSQHPWAFHNYWFGDNQQLGAFKGTRITAYGEKRTGIIERWDDDNFKPKAIVYYGPLPSNWGLLCEGYRQGTATTDTTNQYSGWYCPSPDNKEGAKVTDQWWDKRYPIRPAVITDLDNTIPHGLSVCNYLASSDVVAPVTGRVKGLDADGVVIERISDLNVWKYGYIGSISNGFQLNIPLDARKWFFTLDVSTEIVDAVYAVQEGFPEVKIVSFTPPVVGTVPSGSTVEVKARIKNTSPDISGKCGYGMIVPLEFAGVAQCQGGNYVWLDALNETDITVTIKNLGTLTTNTVGTFKFVVGNMKAITDYKLFDLTFLAGVAVKDTLVYVYTKEYETNKILNGLTVTVKYDVGYSKSIPKTTDNSGSGLADFNLNNWVGSITIEVKDIQETYETKIETMNVVSGSNTKTIYLVKKGIIITDWLQYLPYIVGSVVAISGLSVGIYLYKKKGIKLSDKTSKVGIRY